MTRKQLIMLVILTEGLPVSTLAGPPDRVSDKCRAVTRNNSCLGTSPGARMLWAPEFLLQTTLVRGAKGKKG